MIGDDFGMHKAGVSLLPFLLLLLGVRVMRAIEVNRPYLSEDVCRKPKYARDYDCKIFSHFVWL